jgi:hypothetical protein
MVTAVVAFSRKLSFFQGNAAFSRPAAMMNRRFAGVFIVINT